MFAKKELKKISKCLEIDIQLKNGLYVSDNKFFYTVSRAIAHNDKTFRLSELSSNNRCLSDLIKKLDQDVDDYLNFQWTTQKHQWITGDSVKEEDGYLSAISDFTIKTEFDMIHVKKGNRIIPAFTIDGLETGAFFIYGNKTARVFTPDNSILRFINHDEHSGTATITSSFMHRSMNSRRKNLVLYEMIPSLINSCKAGITHTVVCSTVAEKEFSRLSSKDVEMLSVKTLRVGQKTIIDLVDKHILTFSTKDAREAAMNIVRASKNLGRKIPQRTTDILATLCRDTARVDDNVKKFIYGLIESFFSISRVNKVIFSDRYSQTQYEYTGMADHAVARKIAKNIMKVPAVKEALGKITLDDMIFTIHEYASNHNAIPAPVEDSLFFGGTSMSLNFDTGSVLFNDVKNKNKTKAAKWLSNGRWKSAAGKGRGRGETYKFVFFTEDDSRRALASSFALQIAMLLDINYQIHLNVRSHRDKGIVSRYYLSTAFNYFELISPPSDLLTGVRSEIGIVMASDDDAYPDRGIVLHDRHTPDAINMTKDVFSSSQLTINYRLPSLTPSKVEVNIFYGLLSYIVRTYSDVAHARDHLSEDDNLNQLCQYQVSKLVD